MSIHLIKDERIVWQSHPGKRYRTYIFFRDVVFTFIISLIFHELFKEVPTVIEMVGEENIKWGSVGIGVFGFLFALFHQISFMFTTYYITTERTVIKKGFISRDIKSIKHEHVHDTHKSQTIFDRLLGCGTIRIFTANDNRNSLDPYIKIPTIENIDNPAQVHTTLEQWLEENMKNH